MRANAPQIKRIKRLRQLIEAEGLDAIVIRDRVNTRYLTGFQGTYSLLIVDSKRTLFLTDPRYGEAAGKELGNGFEVLIQPPRDVQEWYRKVFKGLAYRDVGYEGSITVDEFDQLRAFRVGRRYVKAGHLVSHMRMTKDDSEISTIRKAVHLADRMMKQVLASLKLGMTEGSISRRIRVLSEELGGEGESFPNIVASGPNSSRPHHHPGKRKLRLGDVVTVDLGGIVDGYCSDLTRTVVLGKVPDGFDRIYKVCLEANQAAIEAIKPGITGYEVDAIARGIIEKAGYGEYFGHGLGHGVGLEIHEEPRLSPRAKDDPPLKAGNIVTVEPGIYIPGRYGVRIEDYVLVTRKGVEVLSKNSKNLKILGAR